MSKRIHFTFAAMLPVVLVRDALCFLERQHNLTEHRFAAFDAFWWNRDSVQIRCSRSLRAKANRFSPPRQPKLRIVLLKTTRLKDCSETLSNLDRAKAIYHRFERCGEPRDTDCKADRLNCSKDLHHNVPILYAKIHHITWPGDRIGSTIKVSHFERAVGAIDCTSHFRDRVHPRQAMVGSS